MFIDHTKPRETGGHCIHTDLMNVSSSGTESHSNLGSVVEGDVVHAEVRLQALESAVRRVHHTAAAVAAQSHGVGDHRVHAGRTVRKLEGLIEQVTVRAHVLVHVAEGDLDDRVLDRSKHTS